MSFNKQLSSHNSHAGFLCLFSLNLDSYCINPSMLWLTNFNITPLETTLHPCTSKRLWRDENGACWCISIVSKEPLQQKMSDYIPPWNYAMQFLTNDQEKYWVLKICSWHITFCFFFMQFHMCLGMLLKGL